MKGKKIRKRDKDRSGFQGPTLVLMECPNCCKRRMQRPPDHKVILAKYLSPDKQEERYIDVCHVCQFRYYQADQKYKNTKVKMATEALEKGENIPDGASLEDAL